VRSGPPRGRPRRSLDRRRLRHVVGSQLNARFNAQWQTRVEPEHRTSNLSVGGLLHFPRDSYEFVRKIPGRAIWNVRPVLCFLWVLRLHRTENLRADWLQDRAIKLGAASDPGPVKRPPPSTVARRPIYEPMPSLRSVLSR